MKKYFSDIWLGIFTVVQGMNLTLRHLRNARKSHANTYIDDKDYFLQDTGIVTLSYPYEKLPIPDHGRYKLHNEMDDCIVCDKCAVICPVDCIAIDAIKSSEPIGVTSDGSVKRLYAATFDIDMAKCCFCGLCTSVCPTECLTMTNEYDFSTYSVKEMNFEFANLTKEEANEKRALYESFIHEKDALKKQKEADQEIKKTIDTTNESTSTSAKPIIKPFLKPSIPTIDDIPNQENKQAKPSIKIPTSIKPIIKPVSNFGTEGGEIKKLENEEPKQTIKMPVGLKPIIKPIVKNETSKEQELKKPEIEVSKSAIKMPVGLKPIIKPVIKKIDPPSEN